MHPGLCPLIIKLNFRKLKTLLIFWQLKPLRLSILLEFSCVLLQTSSKFVYMMMFRAQFFFKVWVTKIFLLPDAIFDYLAFRPDATLNQLEESNVFLDTTNTEADFLDNARC